MRRAERDDRTEVVTTVSDAFAEDPAWRFLLGDEYQRLAPLFAGALFDARVDLGSIWVTTDLSAVAMWDPPADGSSSGKSADSVWAHYRSAVDGATWSRLAAYEAAVSGAQPDQPFWYLGVLATRPDHQGRGLATAVLAPVLREADEAGLTSGLETSTEDNRAFYGRRGFTRATELHITGAPRTWWLQRSPADSRGRA